MQNLKRKVLYFVYRLLRVDINFDKKCQHCFSEYEYQTVDGEFVCEEHNKRRKNG